MLGQRMSCSTAGGVVLMLATLMVPALTGCRTKKAPRPETAGEAPASAADVYHARGVVEQLPEEGRPDHSIYIHHEPLPDFRDETGSLVGMESMTMPFPVDKTISLAGIAAGDTVAFTFEVRWRAKPGYRLTEIQKLPAGTALNFGSSSEDD